MPEITPNQRFKHGTKTYEKDQTYLVSEGEAYYFEQCGWVGPKQPPTGEVHNLEVQDTIQGQKSEVK